MDTFEEFLDKKKVASEAFRQGAPDLWEEWKGLFEQMHPNSFTAQKLFLINKIRREFPLQPETDSGIKATGSAGIASVTEEKAKKD
ncbi:MAG: hypothetical protein RIG62_25785 [Cyclobacteriaceae bacterium]